VQATTHDVLVIGHGLAGAVLVDQLMQRGLRVHVLDAPRPFSASMAAGGVVNPISLRRDIPTWKAATTVPLAFATYAALEQRLGGRFWQPIELIKLFPNAAAVQQWERSRSGEAAAYLSPAAPPAALAEGAIAAPHGHGSVNSCAWLDLPAMLQAQRVQLLAGQAITSLDISTAQVHEDTHQVAVEGFSAPWLVHCAGPFSQVPGLVPVKGEVLTVRIAGLALHSMVHSGIFLLPLGAGLFRVGSTYAWEEVWSGPTDEAREYLLGRLRQLLPHAQVEVVDHRAGVRPTARDRRPLLGRISPRQLVLNGLGSRGVLLAPWCAQHLADHLLLGTPLDGEVDRSRSDHVG
jgi:glycine oxidase